MRVLVVVAVVLAGCSSSSRPDTALARKLLAWARGTSVFGPTSEYVPSELPEVGTSAMFGVRSSHECEIAVLPNGEDSFAARMDLLARAKTSIRIEALIFTGDEAGLRVAEVLKQKKREGVDVKVIIDAVSNTAMQTQWMYFDLRRAGVEIEGYEALGVQLVNEIPMPRLTPHDDPQHPNMRYHEKLWIVDAGTPNAEAVTGGLNIANEYFRIDPANVKRYWRDQDVLVRGTIVDDLTATFDRNWKHFKQLDAQHAGVGDLSWQAAAQLMDGHSELAFERRDELVKTVAAFEARPVPRDYQPARCRFFQSRPRLAETFILQAYLKLLDSAKHEVLIANAYFLPTVALRMAIKAAAARCVRVVILSNSADTSDTPGMNVLGRGYYEELLSANAPARCKAGVEIWEWLGRAPQEPRQTQGLLHAKYAVVDRAISLVGSYNLDPRSERLNSESALVYENTAASAQLATQFLERDLATARRISAQEAAEFARPSSLRKRLEKELAALLEGNL